MTGINALTVEKLGPRLFLTTFIGKMSRDIAERAYAEFERRVASVTRSKTDQVRDAVMRRTVSFGISEIEHDSPGVSRDMVRHVLRQMKKEGVIAPTGVGRGAQWRKVER